MILLQEKSLLNKDALDRRIEELQSQYDHAKEVVLDLDARMKSTRKLLEQVAAYNNTKNIAQQLKAAKRPAAFEEQHRAELTAYRAAAAYFKENDITKLPSPKKLEAEYRLHNAESLMRKSWEITFDLNPKLLTHPEQVKVLRFALKAHLEFLKTLDEVLAESSGESSKTA